MKLSERRATDADRGWLWELYQNLLKPSISEQWGWEEKFQLNLFKTDLPVKEFIIYSKAGVDVGASLVRTEADHYYVKMLLIDNEYQRMGIGRLIMERLKTKAECNSRNVRFSVINANDVAGFYERLGFVITGEGDGSTEFQFAP